MKKLLAFLLTVIMVLSLCSCSSENGKSEIKRNEYVLSEKVKEESVIDGMMTDISGNDPILQRTTASWLDTAVLYEVNLRQYTEEGTFRAFEEHLQRLKDMGVNVLWLMPIHPISQTGRKGTLGSYYAVSDYRAVNPEFGTQEDFRHLMETAHGMGFKVILDWVANHTGWDHAWITEHPDWYVRDKNGEIESPYDWTDTAKLNYENYEMRAEMIRCMQYWIEEFGVDGYRCDHAIGVPAKFWNAAVYQLKSVNSEIMMLAETSAAESLTAYAFDTCYNDNLYGHLTGVRGGVGLSSVTKGMVHDERYADGSFPMNYLDNHDKNSYTDSIEVIYRNAYPALLAITFLSPGMPMLYTSDEEGYDHSIEFFEKDTVTWDKEPKYAPLITALAKLKAEQKALASTDPGLEIITADDGGLFAFARTADDGKVIYLANLFYEPIQDVGVAFDFDKAVCVLHHDGTTTDTAEKEMKPEDFKAMTLNPYEFYVLVVKG